VTRQIEKVYLPSSLEQYTFWQRAAINFADRAFYMLIKLIGSTVRFEVRGREHLSAIEAAGKLPIYAVWHDRIFLGTYFLRGKGIVFLTSQSFDGEYIARFLQRFGFGVIRGSSTRGGAKALVEMVRTMRSGLQMGFTIDGPKGPRYIAKSGAILLAKKTSNPIIPFSVTPKRYFTINSWDRLQIPLPFTSALVSFREPLSIEDAALDVEECRRKLQVEMGKLVTDAEAWRNA
jgi:lysophospholipid acyltransferase (LPLAT)-like uncharacterized protein